MDTTTNLLNIQLPIYLHRGNGENIASIWVDKEGKFHYYFRGLDPSEYESYDFIHLIQYLIGRVYDNDLELKRQVNEYGELKKALSNALRTPWNNL